MPESTLGVGIVGVSPVRGWAATAHIPALRALPDYEIRALSTTTRNPRTPQANCSRCVWCSQTTDS
jgi:predicted dehydrogenase